MDPVRKTVVDIMTNYVRANTLTESSALTVLRLPMIVVDDTYADGKDSSLLRDALDGKSIDLRRLPFDDATYWIRNYGLYRITLKDETTNTELFYTVTIYLDPGDKPIAFGNIVASIDLKLAVSGSVITVASVIKPGGDEVIDSARTKNEELITMLEISSLYALCSINEFLHKCETTDRSAVVRTPRSIVPRTGSKTVNKLRQAYDNAPRVCYLRTMPSPSDPTGMCTGIKLKPHQRIKHTRTLRHGRYKNHPLFQVPDGIKIDTYWVGEKYAEYQGNIYKLLE